MNVDIVMTDPMELVSEALGGVPPLAKVPNILDAFGKALHLSGTVGEERLGKLLFLSLTSRLLDQPVSVAVKGPSSAGKSFTIDRVLSFFPASAYFERTSMSSRTLAYTKESFEHRYIVLFEAAGISEEDDIGQYLIRSLLSEGRLLYEFVDSKKNETVLIDKPGPTGLIVSTTAAALHPENETRMLSVTVTDTREQTRRVLHRLAEDTDDVVDRRPWMDLQAWLEGAEHRAAVPFASILADETTDSAVRMRRDFKAVLNLIKANAILHQLDRERDDEGRIIASVVDYEVVHGIVVDVVSEGIGASVSDTIRDTVAAVEGLSAAYPDGVPLGALAVELNVDKSVASRRAAKARHEEFLENLEDRRGRPARFKVGEPLPKSTKAIPEPEVVAARSASASQARLQHPGQSNSQQPLDATAPEGESPGHRLDSGTVATVADVAGDGQTALHDIVVPLLRETDSANDAEGEEAPDPAELALVVTDVVNRCHGNRFLAARELAQAGVPSPDGNAWTAVKIELVLSVGSR